MSISAIDVMSPSLAKFGPYKFIDLFCGIGGTRLGFMSTGCKCVFSCDWDKFARQTYAVNFGDTPAGDIRQVTTAEIPDHDILIAGFPCQPFSISGISKKNSLNRPNGFADLTQGTLFFEIKRILSEKRPRAFLLENVKHLVNHDNKRTFAVIIQALAEELGYSVFYKVIDARNVVPQHRERIYIVGFRSTLWYAFPEIPDNKPRLQDILEHSVSDKYTLTDHLWHYLQQYAAKHKLKGNGFTYGLADLNGVSRTLSARYHKDGSEILIPQHERNPRRLTPRECARLMGFPEWFKIPVSDTQAYRQFGNSVVVPVIENIARSIVDVLLENDAINENKNSSNTRERRAVYSSRSARLGKN
jgi:DNA (cytosine-5)-methyltransferase 1